MEGHQEGTRQKQLELTLLSPLAWRDDGPSLFKNQSKQKSSSRPTLPSPLADATLIEVDFRAKANKKQQLDQQQCAQGPNFFFIG